MKNAPKKDRVDAHEFRARSSIKLLRDGKVDESIKAGPVLLLMAVVVARSSGAHAVL
jgi:hypothetical protein